MKSVSFLFKLITVLFTFITYGQTSNCTYYRDIELRKKTNEKNAKFASVYTQYEDGIVVNELKNLETNQIITTSSYKGDEPIGIWKVKIGKEILILDYNFKLEYLENFLDCIDTLYLEGIDYFKDNDSLKYLSPKLDDNLSIYSFINQNLVYPTKAMDLGITGQVQVYFKISKEGEIQNIKVSKGSDILLQKEAVRVFKLLKFNSPAIHDEIPVELNCLMIPLTFNLY